MTENQLPTRFQPASDRSLLVHFGEEITLETHHRVLGALRSLESLKPPGILDLHPAYCSILLVFDPVTNDHSSVEAIARAALSAGVAEPLPEPRFVEIPVSYGGEFGPDLEAVAQFHKLSPSEVVDIHSSAEYFVCFLGFAPGFAYLGGFPESLATPRLDSPRKSVPAGSVGIGGSQTAVYPFSTPGGWRLIGRTPVEMFRADRPQMSLLSAGDRVRFVPIPPEDFERHRETTR